MVNCNTSPLIVGNLIQFFVDASVNLRSLSLVRMQISGSALNTIATFLEESEHLQDLDISWNNLIPRDFLPLLKVISRNKTLRILNLSCNSLLEKKD